MAKEIPVAKGGLPVLGHAVRLLRRPEQFLESLRAQGDIVALRLGPLKVYAVTSPALVHQMLVTQARGFDKGRVVDKVRGFFGNGIVCSDGSFHTRQRRLLQPAFHHRRFARYAEIMLERTEARVAGWPPGRPFDLARELHELSLDIAAGTLFSADLDRSVVAEIQQCLPVVLAGAAKRTLSPFDFLEKLPTPGNRRFKEADRRLRAVIDAMIEADRLDGTDRGDLVSMVLAARDAGTGERMTDQQAQDELVTLLVAGAETTANTLGFLFSELCSRPEVQQRVATELENTLQGRSIGFADVGELRYLNRVLAETLRLHHPTWLLMRRATTPVRLAGRTFPPGTEFLFSIPRLHADPGLFPEPRRFDPDRWLTTPADALPKGGYLPFGAGNRQCIGNDFAWLEMAIMVSAMVGRWELKAVPGQDVHPVHAVVARLNHLPVTCHPRVPPES